MEVLTEAPVAEVVVPPVVAEKFPYSPQVVRQALDWYVDGHRNAQFPRYTRDAMQRRNRTVQAVDSEQIMEPAMAQTKRELVQLIMAFQRSGLVQ